MPEQPESPQSIEPLHRRPVWTRWLIGSAAVLLGILLIVWNIFPAPTIDTPLTLVRNAQGEFESDQEVQGATLQVQAGRIEAKNSLTSTNSSASSSGARHCFEKVLLICKSHDALSQRVAADLLAELKKVPQFNEIQYLPPGHPLPTSGRGPDLFVQLELLSLSESGLIDHQVDARFRARWGISLVDSHHMTNDHHTPPLIQSQSNAELEHHSTTREVASSAAKYKLVAADIAKQFGGAIAKEVAASVDKNGLLPKLPAEFYPAYAPAPQMPLEDFSSELTFSGSGLLKHNETIWQCRGEGPVAASLEQLRERLDQTGYKVREAGEPLIHLRATKGARVVEAFDDDPRLFKPSPPDGQAHPDAKREFVVTFTQWATTDERSAAIDRLIDEKADLQTLEIFAHSMSKEQNQRLLERFTAEPPQDALGWLWAGQIYQRNQELGRALGALKNAVLLRPLSKDQAQLETALASLAKELGDDKLYETLKKQPLDFDRLKRLGFQELTADQPVTSQFDLGGSGRFFVRGADDAWELVSCSVNVTTDGRAADNRYELHVGRVSPHGSSRNFGQQVDPLHGAQQQMGLTKLGVISFNVKQVPGQPRFELKAELRPDLAQNSAAKE